MKRQPKKERPFDLHNFLVGKLRSATRKWPPYNEVKAAAKVPVTVEYIENSDGKFLKATTQTEPSEVIWVKVYKKMQNRDRVMFKCACCGRLFFDYEYLPTKKGGIKKKPMLAVDHRIPAVDPATGFTDWSNYINRLFCDPSNLQLLCNYSGLREGKPSCHAAKTAAEKAIEAERRRNEKLANTCK